MNLPLVYLYGPTGRTRTGELRHSLRSVAANLPHSGLWLAGWAPAWTSPDVRWIPVPDVVHEGPGAKHAQTTANLLEACLVLESHGHDSFVLMNDDFFVVRPVDGVPMLHAGPMVGSPRTALESTYGQAHRTTVELLAAAGIPDPVSYELHTPMVINARLMAAVLREYGHLGPICKRSLYGNLAHAGGSLAQDVKAYGRETVTDMARLLRGPFLSTSDTAWHGRLGLKLRARFPEACRYEASPLG